MTTQVDQLNTINQNLLKEIKQETLEIRTKRLENNIMSLLDMNNDLLRTSRALLNRIEKLEQSIEWLKRREK